MLKCCIFDLDGTILDTLTTITYYVNNTLTHFGIEKITEEECKYFVGEGAYKLITRALLSKGLDPEPIMPDIFKHYNAAYDAEPMYLTKPFSGIPELLGELKAAGIRLAVLSNKPDFATRGVVSHFYGDIFDIVRGGIDGIPLKPDPTAAQRIIAELGISPEECAWIGDTSTDMKTGRNLGVRLNIGVPWGFREAPELWESGADTVVSTPADIAREVFAID